MTDVQEAPQQVGPLPATVHREDTQVQLANLLGTDDAEGQLQYLSAKAAVLARVVHDQGLARNFGGERAHVQVEGWQFLAAMMGLSPYTVWTRLVPDSEEPDWRFVEKELPSKFGSGTYTKTVKELVKQGTGGWEARVEVHTLDGRVVAAGEAEVRWTELNWRDRDSYALRSMAQTRATSKALRNCLAFVMVLAGFAATPAEEMDGVVANDGPPDPRQCPACGAGVYDNVDRRRTQGWNGPAFKCKNKSCTGVTPDGENVSEGKRPGEPWVTWHENYFTRNLTAEQYVQAAGLPFEDGDDQRQLLRGWLLQQAGGFADIVPVAWQKALDELDVPPGQVHPWEVLVRLVAAAAPHANNLAGVRQAELDEQAAEGAYDGGDYGNPYG